MCYEYEIHIQEKFRKAKQEAEELKKQQAKPAPEKDSGKKPQTQEEPVPA